MKTRTVTRGKGWATAFAASTALTLLASGCASSADGDAAADAPAVAHTQVNRASNSTGRTSSPPLGVESSDKQDTTRAESMSGSGTDGATGHTPATGATSGGQPGGLRHRPVSGEMVDSKRQPNQARLLNSMSGKRSGSCVVVKKGSGALRSGEIAIGGFAQARNTYRDAKGQGPVTVYLQVIPQHASMAKRLSLTATSQGGQSKHVTSTDRGTANGWTYFSVALPISKPGTWTFKASVGSDRGCFIANFPA